EADVLTERLRYIRADYLRDWLVQLAVKRVSSTDHQAFAKNQDIAKVLADNGVGLLAGTDTPNPFSTPGFGLHDELAWMVHAGLTSAAALRAATLGPAEFLGHSNDLGQIAPGYAADMVLLRGNPLDDIRNTS